MIVSLSLCSFHLPIIRRRLLSTALFLGLSTLDSGLSPIADPVKQVFRSFLFVLHPSPFSGGLSRRLRNNLEDISIMGFCVIYYRPEVTDLLLRFHRLYTSSGTAHLLSYATSYDVHGKGTFSDIRNHQPYAGHFPCR